MAADGPALPGRPALVCSLAVTGPRPSKRRTLDCDAMGLRRRTVCSCTLSVLSMGGVWRGVAWRRVWRAWDA